MSSANDIDARLDKKKIKILNEWLEKMTNDVEEWKMNIRETTFIYVYNKFFKLHILSLNALPATIRKLVFFGIDIWQRIIENDAYLKRKLSNW